MRRRPFLGGLVLLCSILSGGCTELLLDGKDYYLDEGDEGAGGAAAGGGPTGLSCDEGLTRCDSACVRIESDSRHCGACGHDCLGAACSAGLCATEEIAGAIADPRAFAVGDAYVYWTTGAGAVQRAPKAGGAVETIADEQNDPGPIAVDGKRVYWINRGDGTLLKRKKDGLGATKIVFDGGEAGSPEGLALDADSLYFTRCIGQGDIRRARKETDDLPEVFMDDQPGATQIRTLGAGLAWSGFLDPWEVRGGGVPGSYVRFTLREGRGELLTLAEGEGEITALASAGETAVWADATAGRIRARGIGDSEPFTVADTAQVVGLAADEASVFWVTSGGNVSAHALGSGATRVLAVDLGAPGAIAVDATHVYILLSGASGGVVRVAR